MINSGFVSIASVVLCILMPWFNLQRQLLVVGIASMCGVYIIGSRNDLVSFHLYPGPIVALCFSSIWIIRTVTQKIGKSFDLAGIRYLPALAVYSLLITCISPIIFADRIFVIRPNAVASEIREALPISFTLSSIAQSAYLIVDVILVAAAASLVGDKKSGLRFITNIYLKVGLFFSISVIGEVILSKTGYEIHLWDLLMGESLGEIRPPSPEVVISTLAFRRAVAVFTESSSYSVFMLGCVGASIIEYRANPSPKHTAYLIILVVGIMLAFSTTAVVGLLITTLVAMISKLTINHQKSTKLVGTNILTLLGVAVVVGLIAAALLNEDYYEFVIEKIFNNEGYEEGNYSSAAERGYWNRVSFQAFIDSYGLGCGAGATRASSFLVSVLSSFGIFGIVAIYFILADVVEVLRKTGDVDLIKSALMWCGWFVGLSIANPDGVSAFYIWIQFGLIVGVKRVSRINMGQ